MRLALAALWYEQGIVSQGMAARAADLPRGGFLKALPPVSLCTLAAQGSRLNKS
jgi:hypothetical protein